MFAAVILDQWVPKDNSLDLDELLADPDPAARLLFAGIVVGRDVSNAKALEILRAGLESSDERMRSSATARALRPDLAAQARPGGRRSGARSAQEARPRAASRSWRVSPSRSAPNQAEVQAALRLLSFAEDEPKK